MQISLTNLFPKSAYHAPLNCPHGSNQDEVRLLLAGAKPLAYLTHLTEELTLAIADNSLICETKTVYRDKPAFLRHSFVSTLFPEIASALEKAKTAQQVAIVTQFTKDTPPHLIEKRDQLFKNFKETDEEHGRLVRLHQRPSSEHELQIGELYDLSRKQIGLYIDFNIELVKQNHQSHIQLSEQLAGPDIYDQKETEKINELKKFTHPYIKHIGHPPEENLLVQTINIIAQPKYANQIAPVMELIQKKTKNSEGFNNTESAFFARALGYLPQDNHLYRTLSGHLPEPLRDALTSNYDERLNARINFMLEQGDKYPAIVEDLYEKYEARLAKQTPSTP